MRHSRVLVLAAFAHAALLAQSSFDAKLPPEIPPVEGNVQIGPTLRYIDMEPGTGGVAAPGKRYTVHYTGWLRDGKRFDSSRDRNEPIDFVQGRRQVIAGWEIGFEGMKVGGKRRLFIPPQLAYGAAGAGPIPPNAELVFDVELVQVDEAVAVPAAVDLLVGLADLEKKYLALAEAIPAEKLGWRPTGDTRSFSEVLIHVTEDNRLLREVATGEVKGEDIERRAQASARLEKVPASKGALITNLKASFAEVRKAPEPMRAGSLAREGRYLGSTNTVRGVFVLLENHAAEHLGQLIAYSRMISVRPPWSQPAAAEVNVPR